MIDDRTRPAGPPPPGRLAGEPARAAAFSWKARGKSFRYAFAGVCALLHREHNAWLHLGAAVAAVVLGAFFGISRVEWCVVLLAIGGVFSAEAFNTAIETLANAVRPERDPLIGKAKDLAAGGVLLMSFGAAGAGAIIFIPRLLALLPHSN